MRRADAEVVLEPADPVSLGASPGEDELQVLEQVGAKVHEENVARTEAAADHVEPAVVGGAAPEYECVQVALRDDGTGGLVPFSVRWAEQRRASSVPRGEIVQLVADLVPLIGVGQKKASIRPLASIVGSGRLSRDPPLC